MYLPLFVGLCFVMHYFVSFLVLQSPYRGRENCLLCFNCFMTVNVLWLSLTVPWVGLQCVIWVFPDQTHLHFLCRMLHNIHVMSDT